MAEHNHEHEHHHHEMPQKSHIEEALGKYNLDITDEEVKEAVKKIIAEKVSTLTYPMWLQSVSIPALLRQLRRHWK